MSWRERTASDCKTLLVAPLSLDGASFSGAAPQGGRAFSLRCGFILSSTGGRRCRRVLAASADGPSPSDCVTIVFPAEPGWHGATQTHRHPLGRRRRLQRPHGARRGRHAGAPQGQPQRDLRSVRRRARRAHRQADGRRRAGRVRERRLRGPLRAARSRRPSTPDACARRRPASAIGSASTWARSSSMATTSTATASTSRRGCRRCAEPGGVALSRTVRDQVAGKMPVEFDDLGEHAVKNIERPVHVFALAPNGTGAITAPRGGRRAARCRSACCRSPT